MSRALLVLTDRGERDRAIHWIEKAPTGTRVVFQAAQRSTDQNSKLWAMLSEVASQCPWHGVKLTAEDWKFVFLDALKRELRMVPNLEGNGFVNIGRSSSNLSKVEMSDLIELIHAFGAQHGVTFHDDPDSSQHSQPTEAVAETDKPASGSASPSPSDAGATSHDWRAIYLDHISKPSDSPKSLLTRHTEALKEIGGEPTEVQLKEMRRLYGLRQRNMHGELSKADYDLAIRELADG